MRLRMRLRVSEWMGLLQQQQKSAHLLLFLGVLPQAPLLLTLLRNLREPQLLILLRQVSHAQDLMKVPRA